MLGPQRLWRITEAVSYKHGAKCTLHKGRWVTETNFQRESIVRLGQYLSDLSCRPKMPKTKQKNQTGKKGTKMAEKLNNYQTGRKERNNLKNSQNGQRNL